MGLFSLFILIFGIGNYSKTGEDIFLFFTKVYFIIFFISVVFFHLLKKFLKKLIGIFPGLWCLFLFFEVFSFFVLIGVKLFFTKTMVTGIYHSDIFIFVLFGCIVSCHYWWFSLRKLSTYEIIKNNKHFLKDVKFMKRIYAGVVDFVIACVIQMVLMMIFILKPLLNNSENLLFNILLRQLIITYCSILFLIIRDIIGKKSIGKQIFKLKIIDKNTSNESATIKRFLRNITWLLGPVDIFVYLINKERLGDKIAGTNIVES
jgi:hypothetical protein